jgi:hypothetical protein
MRPHSDPRVIIGSVIAVVASGVLGFVAPLGTPAIGSTAKEHANERTVVVATLHGRKEVPGPGDPDGKGHVVVALRPAKDRICGLKLAWQNLGKVTSAHIHRGRRGDSGDILVDFTRWVKQGPPCVKVSRPLIRRIAHNPWRYYFNVHTKAFPAGAIRGQLHYRN